MAEQTQPRGEAVILPAVDRYRVVEAMFEGVRVVLSHRGEPYSPAYVQGISGAAFRLTGPCPCAPTCGQVMETAALVRLFGYEAEELLLTGEGVDPERDVDGVIARTKDEIRRGRPLLLWHGFTLAEWDVVVGFDDAAGTFLGRGSYAGLDGYASEPQRRMLAVREICPCLGAIIVGERTGAFDAPAAEIAALQEAVRHARTPADRLTTEELGAPVPWRFRSGLGCYDWWINAFVAEPERAAPFGERYCLGVFGSTHAAAAGCLQELAARYPGAAGPLRQAATSFAAEAKALSDCADVLFPAGQVPEAGDRARSAAAACLLAEAREHYRAGIDAIETALATMTGPSQAPAPAGSDAPAARGCCCGEAPQVGRAVCVEERPGFLAAGCCYRGKNERGEVPALWDRVFFPRWDELRRPPFNGGACYGLERTSDRCAAGEFEYLACLAVDTLVGLPVGMVGWKVTGGACAIAIANNVPDLGAAFDDVDRWLPQSRHWMARDGTCVEYYSPTFADDGVIEIWVPVQPL